MRIINSFNENKAVALLSELLAHRMGICPTTARHIRTAAILHDLGKLRIPDSILNKPGKLDPQEFEIMKTHTTHGAAMLSSIQGVLGEYVTTTALYHHEWHDPSLGGYWGYPLHSLPDYVGIISICDVFTALVSRRAFKEPWPLGDALAYIQNQAGTQFSNELVEVFTSLVRNDSRVPAIFTHDGG